MDAATFLDNFGAIAEAPGGIDRLREMILKTAVRGQLVAQSPDDEPASELLSEIQAAKYALGVDHRRHQDTASGTPVTGPFPLPSSWEWCRLDRFVHLEMGQSPASEFYNQHGDGMPFFQGKADFGDLNPEPRYWCTRPTRVAEPGDVLISVRAPVGPTNVATATCCIGRGLAALRPLAGTPRMYVLWALRAFESEVAAKGTGTTFVAVTRKTLAPFLVPVPPLAEQQRIVEKVHELMALCDDLEAGQQARHQVATRLRASALNALSTANTDGELASAWQRVQANWEALSNDRVSVRSIRTTVLHLGIRGQLLTQDPSDEPAAQLAQQIAAERKRRSTPASRRREQGPRSAPPPEVPLELPRGWHLACLGELVEIVRGISFPASAKHEHPGEGLIACLRTANVQDAIDWDDLIYVPTDLVANALQMVRPGDIVMSMSNSRELVGKVALCDSPRVPAAFGAFLSAIRPIEVLPGFLAAVLRAPENRDRLIGQAVQTTNIANISLGRLDTLAVALPPLAEQQRIVERLDELMALCDTLDKALDRQAAVGEALAASVASHLVDTC